MQNRPVRLTRIAVALSALVALTVGCAPGRLTSTWADPDKTADQYRDIIVFGVAANPNVRRAYEDNFVDALETTGVKVRAAHTLLSDRDIGRARAVQEAVGRSGADGVIVTYLLVDESDPATSASRTYDVPSIKKRLYPYYGRILSEVTTPGYYADGRPLRLEVGLYDAGRTTLVWSGRSETLDPRSEQTLISEVITEVIGKLRADGYLP
jgi:hypothetical protein